MRRSSPRLVVLILLTALMSVAACGQSSGRTVYSTSPTTDVIPYVFFNGSSSGLAGISGSDGHMVWRAVVGPINWPPLILGDAVYLCASPKGATAPLVMAIRRSDGVVRWQTPLTDTTALSPLLSADAATVLANTGKSIDAFDAANGHLRWHITASAEGRPTATPHIALYEQRTADNQMNLIALHSDTGAVAWQHPIFINNVPVQTGNKAIFASDQVVYLPDADQTIMALNLVDGHQLWHSQQKGIVVALGAQTLIIEQGFHPVMLVGLDRATGKSLWSRQRDTGLGETIIDGSVVITTADQAITAVDAVSGSTLWQTTYDPIYSTNIPLMQDGVLFLFSENSQAHGSPGCSGWQNCPDYLRALNPDTGKAYWLDTLSDANGFVLAEG